MVTVRNRAENPPGRSRHRKIEKPNMQGDTTAAPIKEHSVASVASQRTHAQYDKWGQSKGVLHFEHIADGRSHSIDFFRPKLGKNRQAQHLLGCPLGYPTL